MRWTANFYALFVCECVCLSVIASVAAYLSVLSLSPFPLLEVVVRSRRTADVI